MDEAHLPVIDLELASRHGAGAVSNDIRQAFTTTGFCYVRNYGVPDEVIRRAAEAALEFFHLPLEEKLKSKPKQSVRGFNAIGRTKMRGAAAPDYKEYFQIGLELPQDDPAILCGQPLRGPNQWPDAVSRFRPAFERYFEEIGLCGQRLLGAVAVSLGLPDDFFIASYGKPLQRTQAVYYPPHPPEPGVELFGVAPHTDYGCITLLWQDDVGGLEVMTRRGDWISAPPIPGTLVINIGDLLQRWSNGRYFSNQHRVTNRSGRERLSIATFYDPDYDAMIDPCDITLPPVLETQYPPITAGEYIVGRIAGSQER